MNSPLAQRLFFGRGRQEKARQKRSDCVPFGPDDVRKERRPSRERSDRVEAGRAREPRASEDARAAAAWPPDGGPAQRRGASRERLGSVGFQTIGVGNPSWGFPGGFITSLLGRRSGAESLEEATGRTSSRSSDGGYGFFIAYCYEESNGKTSYTRETSGSNHRSIFLRRRARSISARSGIRPTRGEAQGEYVFRSRGLQ